MIITVIMIMVTILNKWVLEHVSQTDLPQRCRVKGPALLLCGAKGLANPQTAAPDAYAPGAADGEVVISQNQEDPNIDPHYSSPYSGDSQMAPLFLGNPQVLNASFIFSTRWPSFFGFLLRSFAKDGFPEIRSPSGYPAPADKNIARGMYIDLKPKP